jgi:hypothetical protein
MYMGMMKQKYAEVVELLETTNLTAEQIAARLDLDLDIVYDFMADIDDSQYMECEKAMFDMLSEEKL